MIKVYSSPILLGLISFEEFRQTWKLLSSHLKMEISDKAITDLAQSMDFNKDGSIDINEFMEAFRLVDLSTHAWWREVGSNRLDYFF